MCMCLRITYLSVHRCDYLVNYCPFDCCVCNPTFFALANILVTTRIFYRMDAHRSLLSQRLMLRTYLSITGCKTRKSSSAVVRKIETASAFRRKTKIVPKRLLSSSRRVYKNVAGRSNRDKNGFCAETSSAIITTFDIYRDGSRLRRLLKDRKNAVDKKTLRLKSDDFVTTSANTLAKFRPYDPSFVSDYHIIC